MWIKLDLSSFFFILIQFHSKKKNPKHLQIIYLFFLLKNVTEELPLLGLAGLYFLPVGSPVDEVGEGKFGPHVASELIWPQLAFTPH